jgi:hypothetical protein
MSIGNLRPEILHPVLSHFLAKCKKKLKIFLRQKLGLCKAKSAVINLTQLRILQYK